MFAKIKQWFTGQEYILLEDHQAIVDNFIGLVSAQRDEINKLRAQARATVRTGSASAAPKPKTKAPAKARGKK